MKRVMQLCPLLGVVLLIACSIKPAFAQAPVGTISGVVADESGAVIPNATVKIRNKATGAERDLISNAEGSFSAPSLPAGVYEVRVELKGFRTVVREATVETGLTTTADMRLPDRTNLGSGQRRSGDGAGGIREARDRWSSGTRSRFRICR